MLDIILGLVAAVIGAGLFVGGYAFGYRTLAPVEEEEPETDTTAQQLLEQQKQRILEENAAFQRLMDFNVDQIYSVNSVAERR